MRQTTRFAVMCVAVGLAAAACGSSSSSSSSAAAAMPIKIGEISSLTGSYATQGKENKLGAALAVQQINAAGGVMGRQLQLTVEDDQSSQQQATTAFKTLTGDGVSAIVGSSFPTASITVEPMAKMQHVPYISTAITDQQVQPASPYVYMTSPPASAVAEVLDQYFKATGMTKMAVIYDPNNAFAMAGWNDMKAKAGMYGVKFTSVKALLPTGTNVVPAKNSGAKGVMIWATGATAVSVAKQIHTADPSLKLVFSQAQDNPMFTSQLGMAANGIIVASSLGVVGDNLPASPLRTDVMNMAQPFQKANGMYPSQFAFDGYNAVQLIAAALKKAGSTSPTAVAQALNNLTLRQTEGMYEFTPSDHAGLHTGDVAIDSYMNGKFTPTPWSAAQIQSMINMNGGSSGSSMGGSGMSSPSASSTGMGGSGMSSPSASSTGMSGSGMSSPSPSASMSGSGMNG